jgi:glycosyltransferase involved in cell wall biosynthesis
MGGAQQNTMETCAHLNSKRFAASIISGADTGPEGEIISEVGKRGIPLTIIPELVRELNPSRDILALKKMIVFFKKEKPQIVHTHSSKAGIIGRWAAKIAGVPIIIHTVHGWGHHGYQNLLKKKLYIFLERITVKITDRLIVVSDLNAAKGLKDKIGREKKYITIHSSINLDDYRDNSFDVSALKKNLGLNPEALVVGTVGRFSPQKNPLDFVKVAAIVKKKIPGSQFVFIGDGPMRATAENLIHDLDLSKDIIMPGLRNDIPAMLRCMDVFILTSLWEGLPRVIPQAMAAGLPVVANAVDGVCEVIKDGENGFTIPPENVSLMAEKVIELLLNKALRHEIGLKGKETAENEFCLREMIDKIENLYESLLTEKALPV